MKPGVFDSLGLDSSSIELPSRSVALPTLQESAELSASNFFEQARRKGWHGASTTEARCDFAPHRASMKQSSEFYVIAAWRRSTFGPTLSEIKADRTLIPRFAEAAVKSATLLLGHSLDPSQWAVVAAPPRRHTVDNFAVAVARAMAAMLGLDYIDDCLSATSRERIGAEFRVNLHPAQKNIIAYDDFVTTGSTLAAVNRALRPSGYNVVSIVGINNNK